MPNSYEKLTTEDLDESRIMSPETRSPLNGADNVSRGHSKPLAIVKRSAEAPFLAAMQTTLHALNVLVKNQEREQEMALADAEEYYPLRHSEKQ
ncbi:hypothetical protein E4U19_007240 [Claviceps sp. Clav32 group G5]|nr:hypothetical protein E4U19_007240 [Claviceps sp. Clav32 group G5]KAG6043526.1 hypothetical protein E4U39_004395 [Claviceps sp. Clav50 group G5]